MCSALFTIGASRRGILRSLCHAVAAILAVAGYPATANDHELTLAQIISRLEEHPSRIRSVEARFTTRSTGGEAPKLPNTPPVTSSKGGLVEVEWAVKGNREFRKSTRLAPGQRNRKIRETEVFDGSAHYSLELDASGKITRAGIRAERLFHPVEPLRFGYRLSGSKWIAEDLRARPFRITGVEADPSFGTLYVLQGTTHNGRPRRYWLAAERGFLAVRVVDGDEEAANSLVVRHECLRAEQRGSLWFPVWGVSQAYSTRDGRRQLIDRSEITVSHWVINKVPDSRFEVNLPRGSEAWNADERTVSRIASNGEPVLVQRVPLSEAKRQGHGLLLQAGIAVILLLALALLITVLLFLRGRRGEARPRT